MFWQQLYHQHALRPSGVKDFSEFLVTPFPNLLTSNLVEHITDDPSLTDLFDTITVRTAVDYMWKKEKNIYILDMCVYLLFLVLLSTFSILFQILLQDDDGFERNNGMSFSAFLSSSASRVGTAVGVIGVFSFMVYPLLTLTDEGMQMAGIGWRVYFKDFWNWLQLSHAALAIVSIPLPFLERTHGFQAVLSVALYLRWFGVLYYLQAFEHTGPLMIFQIAIDSGYLLGILVLSIVATGFAFFSLQTTHATASPFSNIYTLVFGMFNALILTEFEVDELVDAALLSFHMC